MGTNHTTVATFIIAVIVRPDVALAKGNNGCSEGCLFTTGVEQVVGGKVRQELEGDERQVSSFSSGTTTQLATCGHGFRRLRNTHNIISVCVRVCVCSVYLP
jgi:hypothetical protein